jgi:hypothetical protein
MKGGKAMKLARLLTWATVILMTMALIGGGLTTPHVAWAQAGTWHVATTGSDLTGDGSPARPFATIQHGIDRAGTGDTVLVHPGIYVENINFTGKNIVVGSLFVTTGDQGYIQQTVINGNRADHVVTFASGETAAARLSGLTITNGYAHGASTPAFHGGGIMCYHSNPTLTYLRVSDNEATHEGGGLYFDTCFPTIQNVTATNNRAGQGGGGMRFSYGSPTLENIIVVHNTAGNGGAGIQFYHTDPIVKNALIAGNVGQSGKGGGLHFDGCSPTFINVTIVGNRTAGQGGGLNVSFYSNPRLVNSIVWGNSPEQIYFDTDWPGEAVTIEYSDIQGGQAGIITNGQGPVYWGDGNLEVDPLFVAAGDENYHLSNHSSCIGAGTLDGAPSSDLEGHARPDPAGSNPDMGAYEAPAPPAPVPPEKKKHHHERDAAPPPAPAPQLQEFSCWPWLVRVPPGAAPGAAPGEWCQASLGQPLPAPSAVRYLTHSTEVMIKDAAGVPVTQFAAPIEVCFHYTPPEVALVSGDPTHFLIQTYRNGRWESLPTAPDSSLLYPGVCAPVDHLTLFALFAQDEPAAAAPADVPLFLPETGGTTESIRVFGP